MATSGTYSSSFPIDEILDQAILLAGGEPTLGRDIRAARRALRLLMQDIQTRGVRLSQLESYSVSVSATSTPLPTAVQTVLDAVVEVNGTDLSLEAINFSDYLTIPRKGQTGRPSRYYVNEKRDGQSLYVWPVPTTPVTIKFYAMRRAHDPGAMANDLDTHPRYWMAIIFGLAYHLALIRDPSRAVGLKLQYEEALDLAGGDDRERVSLRVVPRARRR